MGKFAIERCAMLIMPIVAGMRSHPRVQLVSSSILGATLVVIALAVGAQIFDHFSDNDAALRSFYITRDRSVPEQFSYGVTAFCVLALLAAWGRHRLAVFLVFAAFYGFVLADDMLHYHERVGGWFATELGLGRWVGLRPQDAGELIAWSLAGVAIALPGAMVVFGGRRGEGWIGAALLCPVVLLVVFGVGVDMAHILISGGPVRKLTGWVEDGGEMMAIALGASLALLFAVSPHAVFLQRQAMSRIGAPSAEGARKTVKMSP